jgi:hypothetical protein
LEASELGLDRLPVAEELVVGVVAAVPAADLGEVGDEVDAGQPFDVRWWRICPIGWAS